jgi:putative transposase
MQYRRARATGGTYFFTVNLADRSAVPLIRHIAALRESVRRVRRAHHFDIVAMVVLPDHLHAIWTLPEGDADYPLRWSLIKAGFSRSVPHEEFICTSRLRKHERGIWQRRYWEHQIRDDEDLRRHVDYMHFNPVKHGHVSHAVDWPYSTLHRDIERGWVKSDWAGVTDGGFGFGE